MRFKSKVLAGAAAVALAAAPVSVTWTTAASAATPSCGGFPCVDIFSHEFTSYYSNPTYVMDVFRQGAKVGQPIILFRGSNSDPAEDFTASFQGTVSDFYAANFVSAAVELHYGGAKYLINVPPAGAVDEPAWEIEYSPYGVGSGLCVGVGSTAFQNEKVALEPCGVSAKTVWILDTYDQPNFLQNGFTFPVINGSDTNFSHPFVLTYPKNAEPWAKPRAQFVTQNLTGFSNGFGPVTGQVGDNQLFGADIGVLP